MFIGRQHELELLERALKPGASVAVVGASGMGKSELARRYARGRAAVWVDCGGMAEDELAHRIAAQSQAPELAVEAALAGVELLVLDDWTPEIPVSEIRQQFAGAILVTSPLAPPGMASLPVPPFAVPPRADLCSSEAFAAFAAAADGVRLGAAAECDPTAVHEIIERVGGHPLGIVLAARHAAAVGAAEVARLMQHGTDLTDAQRSPRQRSMALALDFSWDRLSPRNQTMLYLASRFDRPVRVETLAELAELTVQEALEAIGELTQCGAVLPGPFPRAIRVWRDIARRRFAADPAAARHEEAIFARAVASARSSAAESTVGPIDDLPSLWEAALAQYSGRDREAVGVIASSLLRWSHRFAPGRYAPTNYLEDVAIWSGDADLLLRRVAFCRGDAVAHRAAIDAARPVVQRPTDHATLCFELAMAASLRGDVDEALAQLAEARQWEESYAALLLEASLRMFREEHEEAGRLLDRLERLETPSPAHAAVAMFHRIWSRPAGQRVELARAAAAKFSDSMPRVRALVLRCVADVLERDEGLHAEARALREQVLALARSIDHQKLADDMRCELAWGAFCAGDLAGGRVALELDPAQLAAEARLRHTCLSAMFACLDGDTALARSAVGRANRRVPHTPSVLGVFEVIDAAIALQEGRTPAAGPWVADMSVALDAAKLSHREQIDVFAALDGLRAATDWSARFALRWIETHGSPFLRRLAALDGRVERVVALADCSAIRVDGVWHHVPETTAAMLAVLATGETATFEALKEAAWPGEVMTWDSLVNRVNVRVSALRGMGLKAVLRKVSNGFVLDCPVYVEPG